MKTKVSKPQERVLKIMLQEAGPFHFIPWGLNYHHIQDANYSYLGRVRSCVFDALISKGLIEYGGSGWNKKATS